MRLYPSIRIKLSSAGIKGRIIFTGIPRKKRSAKISALIRSSALEKGDKEIHREITLKGGFEFESNDFTKDNKSIYCHVSATALKDTQGKLTGYVSVVRILPNENWQRN